MIPSLLAHPELSLGARDHLWTLSVEEHFYLVLPLLLLFLSRRNRGRLPALSILGTALFPGVHLSVLRCFTSESRPITSLTIIPTVE